MSSDWNKLTPSAKMYRVLVHAAKMGALEAGYQLTRKPGRGLSNVWELKQAGSTKAASIRTTRDRWFAFPPLDSGEKWKTLDDVELVIVAAVDDKESPKEAQVYIFDAAEVRKRFKAAYEARTAAGQVLKDNFGMWVALNDPKRGLPADMGSGLADKYKPVARYNIASLMSDAASIGAENSEIESSETEGAEFDEATVGHAAAPQLDTIAKVMAWARDRVAQLAGVGVEAVKLDLKVQY